MKSETVPPKDGDFPRDKPCPLFRGVEEIPSDTCEAVREPRSLSAAASIPELQAWANRPSSNGNIRLKTSR